MTHLFYHVEAYTLISNNILVESGLPLWFTKLSNSVEIAKIHNQVHVHG